MIEQSASIQSLGAAMVAAQSEFPNIPRDQEGQIGKRKYRYASLAGTADIVRPILARHGMEYTQSVTPNREDGTLVCVTQLTHDTGEWRRTWAFVPIAQGATCQDAGVATTYARRYGLAAALGIVVEEDTDGAAGDPPQRRPQQERPRPKPQGCTAHQVERFKKLTGHLPAERIAQGLANYGFEGMGFGDLNYQEAESVLSALTKQMNGRQHAKQ